MVNYQKNIKIVSKNREKTQKPTKKALNNSNSKLNVKKLKINNFSLPGIIWNVQYSLTSVKVYNDF